jgi:hypothetical protein
VPAGFEEVVKPTPRNIRSSGANRSVQSRASSRCPAHRSAYPAWIVSSEPPARGFVDMLVVVLADLPFLVGDVSDGVEGLDGDKAFGGDVVEVGQEVADLGFGVDDDDHDG